MGFIDLYHIRFSTHMHIPIDSLHFLTPLKTTLKFSADRIAIYDIDIEQLGLEQYLLPADIELHIRELRFRLRDLSFSSRNGGDVNALGHGYILPCTDIRRTSPKIVEADLRSLHHTLRLEAILLGFSTFAQCLEFRIVFLNRSEHHFRRILGPGHESH